MTDSAKNQPTRIRTFAGDLAAERARQGLKRPPSDSPKTNIPKPPVEQPVIEESHQEKKEQKPVIKEPHINATPKPVKPATKIPAFHELQKTVTPIQKNNPKGFHTKRTLSKKKSAPQKKVLRTNIGFDATVISDKKTTEFHLLPALIDSVKKWFKKYSAKHKKKTAPKYTVPETERRKGVIQKATSKTATSFTADNETLKEQIRKRRLQEAQDGHDIEPETSWSPFTETGYQLLEEPDEEETQVQNVVVEYKKPRQPEPQIFEPASQEKDSEEESTLDDLRWSTSASEPVAYEPVTKHEMPTEDDLSSPEAELQPVHEDDIETADEEAKTPPQKKDLSGSAQFFNKFDTNTLTVVLLIIVIGFVTILFATKIIIQQLGTGEETETQPNHQVESVLNGGELVTILLTTDNLSDLPGLVVSTIQSAPAGLIELPVISPVGDEVTASYISRLLDCDLLPSFRQSLTSIRFAAINHSDPAVLLQFVDRDTVLGGFLEWEKIMPSNLHNLYNIPSQTSGSFSDESIQGVDVRILRYEGEVVLAYGIIGDNTALITSNTTDFALILELGMPR